MVLLAQFPMRKVLILKQQLEDGEDGATPCMQDLHTKCFTACYTYCSSWLMRALTGSPESRDCTSSFMCILVSIMIPTIPYYGEDLIVLSLLPACKCFTACCTRCSWLMMGSHRNYCTTSSADEAQPGQHPCSYSISPRHEG